MLLPYTHRDKQARSRAYNGILVIDVLELEPEVVFVFLSHKVLVLGVADKPVIIMVRRLS